MKKFIFFLFLVQVITTHTVSKKKSFDQKKHEWLATFEHVISIFDSHYYKEVDVEAGMSEAIKTFTQQDPHSLFLDKKACKALQEKIEEEFFGIGIKLPGDKKKETEYIPIIDITPGSPADKAELQVGDKILQIDAQVVKGADIEMCMNLIRGEKHTAVTLTIIREHETEPKKYTVIRDTIKETNCTSFCLEDYNMHYIALTLFNEKSSAKIESFIKKALHENTKGLIIDLRNNTGGLFDAALDIVGFFVPQNTFVTAIKDRNEKIISEWKTKHAPLTIPENVPCFILVNNYTASASEILVGTLQLYAHKNNIHPLFIIGTETFGKGSVQEIIPLSNSTALKMTTGLYYLPFNNCIQCKGIKPDFVIEKRIEQTESLRWVTETYGKEAALYGSIKKEDEKITIKTDTPKTESWKEKYQASLAHDYYIQNTVILCNIFHLLQTKRTNTQPYNHSAIVLKLQELFTLDKPLMLRELPL